VTVDFNYVIVGAGAVGCVLASRLSEDPGNQVLLLEYGGRDPNPPLYVAWVAAGLIRESS
jgi:choline dehydrogenase